MRTAPDALIDFDRRVYVGYVGARVFELWLCASGFESPRVRFMGTAFRDLLDYRHTIVSEPIRLLRDGLDVVFYVEGEEWARLRAETLRELVRRAVLLARL